MIQPDDDHTPSDLRRIVSALDVPDDRSESSRAVRFLAALFGVRIANLLLKADEGDQADRN